jgi:hypothetical protein
MLNFFLIPAVLLLLAGNTTESYRIHQLASGDLVLVFEESNRQNQLLQEVYYLEYRPRVFGDVYLIRNHNVCLSDSSGSSLLIEETVNLQDSWIIYKRWGVEAKP